MSQNPDEKPDGLAVPDVKTATSKSGWSRRRWMIGGLLLLGVVVIGVILPVVQVPKGTPRRMICLHNIRQLELALQNYVSVHGRLPPAYTVDEDGRPLHSWRSLILPEIECQGLYDMIDFSKPWDDPVNRKAYETEVNLYVCPASSLPKGFTTYLALVTPDSCLRPKESCAMADIKDGTSNTMTIIEVPESSAVHWMSPVDADEELFLRIGGAGFESPHHGGFNAASADGSVRFQPNDTPADVRRALISVAGDDNNVLDE